VTERMKAAVTGATAASSRSVLVHQLLHLHQLAPQLLDLLGAVGDAFREHHVRRPVVVVVGRAGMAVVFRRRGPAVHRILLVACLGSAAQCGRPGHGATLDELEWIQWDFAGSEWTCLDSGKIAMAALIQAIDVACVFVSNATVAAERRDLEMDLGKANRPL
jgi:hypothetical protein